MLRGRRPHFTINCLNDLCLSGRAASGRHPVWRTVHCTLHCTLYTVLYTVHCTAGDAGERYCRPLQPGAHYSALLYTEPSSGSRKNERSHLDSPFPREARQAGGSNSLAGRTTTRQGTRSQVQTSEPKLTQEARSAILPPLRLYLAAGLTTLNYIGLV